MRTMFVVYMAVIVTGLAYVSVLGLMHN